MLRLRAAKLLAKQFADERRWFMGRTLGKTAPRRIPSEGVSCAASPCGFSPPPLVPGLFSFRARVIFFTDGPTRPTQRLPGRGEVPTFPPPEPPLLLAFSVFHVLGSAKGENGGQEACLTEHTGYTIAV
jgi:hypothetical protein